MDHSMKGSIYIVSIIWTLVCFIRLWAQHTLPLRQTPSLGSLWYWFFFFTSPFCTAIVFFICSAHHFLLPAASVVVSRARVGRWSFVGFLTSLCSALRRSAVTSFTLPLRSISLLFSSLPPSLCLSILSLSSFFRAPSQQAISTQSSLLRV